MHYMHQAHDVIWSQLYVNGAYNATHKSSSSSPSSSYSASSSYMYLA